ncbi:MAG: M1 family metallopeptidase [Bacteroidetes bacterium]|nr:M1 family metallopeptidase [Bacteroidota bacterium]
MKRIGILLWICCIGTFAFSQHPFQPQPIDVERYIISLDLTSFSQDTITSEAQIEFTLTQPCDTVKLMLVGKNKRDMTGMHVSEVVMKELSAWKHANNQIRLAKKGGFNRGEKCRVTIYYHGLPGDGLILSTNKHGRNTAFGDNWPNRAHYWFPCIDHPSDKAYVEWMIKYPVGYKSIANGELISSHKEDDRIVYDYWKSKVPLPTKVMVVGLANFAVSEPCWVGQTPVTSWVFEEQKTEGFSDYLVACEVLEWFEGKIAPYPYAKLANVQSKTRYGGMENASCIFYFENSVDGKNSVEDLIAHEIAHQWFGNSASEIDWPHLWLSEGFATYLTDLYILDKYGNEAFNIRMKEEREKAISFYKKYQAPVVDTLASNPNYLLNPNSYQKGAWFLHMLRNEIGDEQFWTVLKTYYLTYELSNASTQDFAKVVNRITGEDFTAFFNQWLRTTGHPKLKVKVKKRGKRLIVKVNQEQSQAFNFNFVLSINHQNDTVEHVESIAEKSTTIKLALPSKVQSVDIDPDVQLLFELLN